MIKAYFRIGSELYAACFTDRDNEYLEDIKKVDGFMKTFVDKITDLDGWVITNEKDFFIEKVGI